jgi:hypothetical protein
MLPSSCLLTWGAESFAHSQYLPELLVCNFKDFDFMHIQQEDSAFVKAMKASQWMLMNDIESIPIELFKKISSLTGPNLFSNLFEKSSSFFRLRNSEGMNRIHKKIPFIHHG